MKSQLYFLAIAGLSLAAAAQPGPSPEAERARIAAERGQAEASFASQEVACYRTFAVNDCLNAAKSQRRERLSDLRRQDLTLNEAERKRRASERVRSIDERNSAQSQQDAAAHRAESVQRLSEKQADLARRAAGRLRDPASAPVRATKARPEARDAQAPSPKIKPARVHDSAEGLRRSQTRQQEAQERRDRVARRLAEGRKDVKSLPLAP